MCRLLGCLARANGPYVSREQAVQAGPRVVQPPANVGLDRDILLSNVLELLQLRGQAAPLGFVDHPQQRDVRETTIPVAAAHVGVHARKPYLLQHLIHRVRLLFPQRRGELWPLLVDCDRVIGIVDVRAQSDIVKLPAPIEELEPAYRQPGYSRWDPERAHSIPDADEVNPNVPGEAGPEQSRLHGRGMKG